MDTRFIGKNTWSEHPEYERGFKAGQQSKQAEIDALKMSNHHLSVQVLDANAYAEHWQKISNKSQAEIDKVKELLNQWDNWISVSDGNNHIDIVKECADELRELLK